MIDLLEKVRRERERNSARSLRLNQHEVWISGKQILFPEGLTSNEAYCFYQQAPESERLDWLKEYEWLRLIEYEGKILEKCIDISIDFLNSGKLELASIFARKTILIEKQVNSAPYVWDEFAKLFPNSNRKFYLPKQHVDYELDGPSRLNNLDSAFLEKAFPIIFVSYIQPYALEAIKDAIYNINKQKIDWFYLEDGEALILSSGHNILKTYEITDSFKELLRFLKCKSSRYRGYNPIDLEIFQIIEKIKKRYPDKNLDPLTYYFESVELIDIDDSQIID